MSVLLFPFVEISEWRKWQKIQLRQLREGWQSASLPQMWRSLHTCGNVCLWVLYYNYVTSYLVRNCCRLWECVPLAHSSWCYCVSWPSAASGCILDRLLLKITACITSPCFPAASNKLYSCPSRRAFVFWAVLVLLWFLENVIHSGP